MKLIVDFENTGLSIIENRNEKLNSSFYENLNMAEMCFSGHGGGMQIELKSYFMSQKDLSDEKLEHGDISVTFNISEKAVLMLANYLNGYTKISEI